jgi:DNA-binding NtrC family response regulator
MTEKILLVDDDVCLLAAMQRNLRKRFPLDTATGGAAALELLARQGPYAVVVADMGMPGMTGAELLRLCLEKFPDTVRIMLTGDVEQEDAVEAVDRARLFKVLSKPCPPDALLGALENGVRQHQLIVSQRETT